jgi:hypothetical protein
MEEILNAFGGRNQTEALVDYAFDRSVCDRHRVSCSENVVSN